MKLATDIGHWWKGLKVRGQRWRSGQLTCSGGSIHFNDVTSRLTCLCRASLVLLIVCLQYFPSRKSIWPVKNSGTVVCKDVIGDRETFALHECQAALTFLMNLLAAVYLMLKIDHEKHKMHVWVHIDKCLNEFKLPHISMSMIKPVSNHFAGEWM